MRRDSFPFSPSPSLHRFKRKKEEKASETYLLPLNLHHPNSKTLITARLVRERDEPEPFGSRGLSIDHDLSVENDSELGKVFLDDVGGGGRKETSDEDFGGSLVLLVRDSSFGVDLDGEERKREREGGRVSGC